MEPSAIASSTSPARQANSSWVRMKCTRLGRVSETDPAALSRCGSTGGTGPLDAPNRARVPRTARLARLASSGQLLAVTHSPQVAARGGQHYFIAKSSEGLVTRTSVAQLDADGRRLEIARMLSGAEVTPEAVAQAVRLLEGV